MRAKGTFPESSNIEGQIAWTYDARNMVQSFADLLTFDASNYIANGFPVAVFDADPLKRGIYMCINKNDLSNVASWEKASGFNSIDYYTKTEVDTLISAVPTRLPIEKTGADVVDYSIDLTGTVGLIEFPNLTVFVNGITFKNFDYDNNSKILSSLPINPDTGDGSNLDLITIIQI